MNNLRKLLPLLAAYTLASQFVGRVEWVGCKAFPTPQCGIELAAPSSELEHEDDGSGGVTH